jgi:hypothetical protein
LEKVRPEVVKNVKAEWDYELYNYCEKAKC